MYGRKMRVVYLSDVYGEDGFRRAHEGDAGLDLRCAQGFLLPAHGTRFVMCGIRVELPKGTFGAIRSRSGLARKWGVNVIDGTVDEGFRGEVGVTMRNDGPNDRRFERGERICQMVIIPYVPVVTEAADELSDSERGTAGYGSTGLGGFGGDHE